MTVFVCMSQYNGQPTPKEIIQVYAHRANRGLMPEQTMPAYTEALRIGCDYVDMDINTTRDNILVVTHDLTLNPDLTRYENGNWITDKIPINEIPYEQLKRYNVGKIKPGTGYAGLFPHQKSLPFVCIPTFKEVIRRVKKIAGDTVGFQIEIKNDPTKPELTPSPQELASSLYALLKEKNILDCSEIQAFDWRCLIELNKIDPTVKTAYLTDHTTISLTDDEKGTWTAGLLPKDYGYSLPRMIKSVGGYCWEPYQMDLTKETLDEAHQLGLKVVVWGWPEMEGTEFNYEAINALIEWGVHGIITDRADMLRGVLASKGFNIPRGFYVEI